MSTGDRVAAVLGLVLALVVPFLVLPRGVAVYVVVVLVWVGMGVVLSHAAREEKRRDRDALLDAVCPPTKPKRPYMSRIPQQRGEQQS